MTKNSLRIAKEYKKFTESGHKNMFMWMDEKDCETIKALIIGPENTPYEGGFFIFDINAEKYPMKAPKVKFLTPDDPLCRLHPNLYAEGKVCLSILGTWGKDEWSPLLTFEKILMTISGLLDDNPIAHEPGYEKRKDLGYSIMARYLTLRTIKSIMQKNFFQQFREILKDLLERNRNIYKKSLNLLKEFENKTVSNLHGTYSITTARLKELSDFFNKF